MVILHRTRTCQWAEGLLGPSTYRAPPVLRQVLKRGPLGDLPLPVPLVRVVDVAAIHCLALVHFLWCGHAFLLILSWLLYETLFGAESRGFS